MAWRLVVELLDALAQVGLGDLDPAPNRAPTRSAPPSVFCLVRLKFARDAPACGGSQCMSGRSQRKSSRLTLQFRQPKQPGGIERRQRAFIEHPAWSSPFQMCRRFSALLCAMRSRSCGLTGTLSRKAVADAID